MADNSNLICNMHDGWTKYTHGVILLHTLLVKYYNDLLGRQNSERDKDEVTFFYLVDLFCIHLDTKYTNFQEKFSAEISGKNA